MTISDEELKDSIAYYLQLMGKLTREGESLDSQIKSTNTHQQNAETSSSSQPCAPQNEDVASNHPHHEIPMNSYYTQWLEMLDEKLGPLEVQLHALEKEMSCVERLLNRFSSQDFQLVWRVGELENRVRTLESKPSSVPDSLTHTADRAYALHTSAPLDSSSSLKPHPSTGSLSQSQGIDYSPETQALHQRLAAQSEPKRPEGTLSEDRWHSVWVTLSHLRYHLKLNSELNRAKLLELTGQLHRQLLNLDSSETTSQPEK